MKICPKCSKRIDLKAHICPNCGREFTDAEVEVSIYVDKTKRRRASSRFWRVVGWILAAIGAMTGVVYLVMSIASPPANEPGSGYTTLILPMLVCSLPMLILGVWLIWFSNKRLKNLPVFEEEKRPQPKPSQKPSAQPAAQPPARATVNFDADGKVSGITVTQGQWISQQSGGGRYLTQKANSLLVATEILKKVGSIPQLTYYVVETPDGALGRDTNGFYTEAAIRTANLRLETQREDCPSVEFQSLNGFGNMQANQSGVTVLKQNGQYAKLVLMMKCGHCGYESPVETQAGALTRECYCCGVKNEGMRGSISVFTGSGMADI